MMPKRRESKKELKERLLGLEAKLRRALADYDNLEKRIAQEKLRFIEFTRAEILDKFIAVLDDLERAEVHLKDKGLILATSQFRAVLSSEGVQRIEAKGKVFDPEKMDCAAIVEGKKNRVINVIQEGYLLKGKAIRPAKVEVGKGKKKLKV